MIDTININISEPKFDDLSKLKDEFDVSINSKDKTSPEDILAPIIEYANESEIKNKEVNPNYRECTCGALVPLPNSSEEFTKCECGIIHKR